jgi:hypothetical protein
MPTYFHHLEENGELIGSLTDFPMASHSLTSAYLEVLRRIADKMSKTY